MTRRRGLLLLGIVLMLVILPHLRWKIFPPGGPPMDTTQWKTYCSGRFLMDIPPNATITDVYGEIWNDQPVWRKDLTPQNLGQEVEAEIEKWKNTLNTPTGGTMYLGRFDLPNGGIAIVRWKVPHSKVFIVLQCYMVTPEPEPRIFIYAFESSAREKESSQAMIQDIAASLRARDAWEIPTEPGFCFGGGFSAYTGEWRYERSGFGIELPEFPGLTIGLDVWNRGIDTSPLSRDINQAMLAKGLVTPGVSILRNGKVMLGDIEAEEVAVISDPTKINEGRAYNFELKVPGLKDRLDRPQVHLAMNNQLHLYDGKKPFTSDTEALSLWDAISRSIRLRPGAI